MSIKKIKKIRILAHIEDRESILDVLYDGGFMEIIDAGKVTDDESLPAVQAQKLQKLEYDHANILHALELLSRYRNDKISLLDRLRFEKPLYKDCEIDDIRKYLNYHIVTEMIAAFSQDINSFRSLIAKIREDIKFLEPWKELGIVTAYEQETGETFVLTGITDPRIYEEMKADGQKPTLMAVSEAKNDARDAYLMVIGHKRQAGEIRAYLDRYGFKEQQLPRLDISIKAKIGRLEREIKTTEARIANIEDRLKSEAERHYFKLQVISDSIRWELEKERAYENLGFTRETFLVTGWLAEDDTGRLARVIGRVTKSFALTELPIEADDDVPVIMDNHSFMQPFEFVTNIYGFPKYNEIDPTPFLAGFFIVFFALNLTDAGYGITITLLSFLALRFLKLGEGFTKLLKVLFVGGIITFFAGALTGGWFGVELDKLPASLAWLSGPLIYLRQVDMVNEPMKMLVFSLMLGYIHLFFGHFIDLWWKARHSRLKDGLVDSGVWMFFLLVMGVWIVSSLGVAFQALSAVSVYPVYISIILIVLTQGKSGGPLTRILGGLGELYFGVSGYVSDILSYSRLLALGLATGIIGMVINIVGSMAVDMVPFVGWVLAVLILIGGHLLNLVISLVGAFIHAGRLQYVEFFKRFFDGGGRSFKPFARVGVYVGLEKNKDN